MKPCAAILGFCLVVAQARLAEPPVSAARAPQHGDPPGTSDRLLFASFAEGPAELEHALFLTESIRAFAGGLHHALIRICAPKELVAAQPAPDWAQRLKGLRATVARLAERLGKE